MSTVYVLSVLARKREREREGSHALYTLTHTYEGQETMIAMICRGQKKFDKNKKN